MKEYIITKNNARELMIESIIDINNAVEMLSNIQLYMQDNRDKPIPLEIERKLMDIQIMLLRVNRNKLDDIQDYLIHGKCKIIKK